jgi:hypothetical protein
MSERPRHYRPKPERPMELKTVLLNNLRPNRFAKLDLRRSPQRASRRPGMSAAHLEAIRQLPCSLCEERRGIQSHHLKSGPAARERGIGMKATDRWAVPLCIDHHAEVERLGSRREREWFLRWAIDPHLLAQALWNAKGEPVRMDFVLRAHKQQALRVLCSASRQIDLVPGEWRRT